MNRGLGIVLPRDLPQQMTAFTGWEGRRHLRVLPERGILEPVNNIVT